MYKPSKELIYCAKVFLSTGEKMKMHSALRHGEFYGYLGCGAQRYIYATKTENEEIKKCVAKCFVCKDCYTAIAKEILSQTNKIKVV